MEQLKHECGVAIIRLLKPISYYKEKYGTPFYGLNKMYLLMEKQHNRGQEAAGIGVIKMDVSPGEEYIYRERALGTGAIHEIFAKIHKQINHAKADNSDNLPFVGNIYMGHLRYSTTGRSGMSYVHPFLRRNNWQARNLLLCGNFNMTNVDEIFETIVADGQHPRIYSDTVMLLEQIGYALDKENRRILEKYRNSNLSGRKITDIIDNSIDWTTILKQTACKWDGGFVICGASGNGDTFALRDSHGIRPAFYYVDEEICVIASERPVIQTVMNVSVADVKELCPGSAIIVNRKGDVVITDILGEGKNERCSFERIYFSRGGDVDIYRERKQLGLELTDAILSAVNYDIKNTVFSFIPNTAEIAYLGMLEGIEKYLDHKKASVIASLDKDDPNYNQRLIEILNERIRSEKIAFKDIKLRTFIAEGSERDDLATHVYDVAYGVVRPGVDNVVVIDDSIVRGTTLRQSIVNILSRLQPKKIVIVSSSPQVRYPDYYGIDMSRMNEFCAFRAAISLLKDRGKSWIIDEVYGKCIAQRDNNPEVWENYVKEIYSSFSDKEISDKIAQMLTPDDVKVKVEIVYQTLDGLHRSIPSCPGNWYFSGDYPTQGGVKMLNQAYINYYEGNLLMR